MLRDIRSFLRNQEAAKKHTWWSDAPFKYSDLEEPVSLMEPNKPGQE